MAPFPKRAMQGFFSWIILFAGMMPRRAQAVEVHPQTADLVKERFSWTAFPELAAKGVTSIAEDSTGNLWFGTEAGILRYDGRRWQNYTQKNGLPAAAPQSIKTADDGRLYALYETEGVFTLSDTLWQAVPILSSDSLVFNDILPIGGDSLWAAADRGAVLVCPDSSYLITLEGTLAFERSGGSDVLPDKPFNVYSIHEDRRGNLWLIHTSSDQELLVLIPRWRVNLRDRSQWQVLFPSQKGHSLGLRPKLFQASDGRYWIYTYSEEVGLIHFNDPDGKWSYIDLIEPGGTNVVLSILETGDRVVWFGGNGYLYAFKNEQITIYKPEQLRLPIAGLELLQSRDGALWLAAVNVAVFRIDYAGQNWRVYNDLHYQCRTGDRRYFLSADGRVVQQGGDSQWNSSGVEDGLMDMPVVVLTDSAGGVWAAGSHRGIAAVSRLTGKRWQTDTFPDLSWSIGHLSALVDREGQIWFGSIGDPSGFFRGGCVVYQPHTKGYSIHRIISITESFNRINALTMTRDGRVWAGASYLLSFQGADWKTIGEPKELQKGWIDHVLGASDGSLWASKGGIGVFRLNGCESQRYSTENGLAGNMVTFLLEIPGGILAATEMGISRFDGAVWMPHYLPPEITVPRESGTLRFDPDGSIWINLAPRDWYFRALKLDRGNHTKGFRCLSYRGDLLPPRTEIIVYQSRLATPANPYIAWQGHDAWGATPQEDLMYSYCLDDGEWSPYSSATSVQLLDIKEGRRRFQVHARDRDGNVEPEPVQIAFEIIPPIWKQPWFLLLVILFSAALIGLLIVLGIKNKKLTEAKNEIERIASFKERFFINISHEFRTPLTMILAPISAILDRETGASKTVIRQLQVMRHHAHYLLRLVNQLLDLRKLESGKFHLQVAQGDLIAAVRRIMALFNWFAKEHKIRYNLHTELQNRTVYFDFEKLEDVLANLIGNAFKYTPNGGDISVTLVAHTLPAPGKESESLRRTLGKHNGRPDQYEWVEIKVSDSGIGIPPERLTHIFDRFYTVEHPGGLYYDSIGVGLDLTREMVELQRGSIHVESTIGVGTTFTVLLPVDRRLFDAADIISTDAGTASLQLSPEKTEEINQERKKLLSQQPVSLDNPHRGHTKNKEASVLIVEDHPDMRRMLVDFFAPSYVTLQAEDGQSGVEIALQKVPDLVISDIMMPRMDGIELTRRLKSNTITSHIPIILLTMKGEVEHRIEGFETGADAYLAKPFEFEELAAILRNQIESRKKLQQKFRQEIVVQPTEVTINNVDANFLTKCISIVEEHIADQHFHVDQFCRELGMSRTPAFQKIKSISGFTPNDFIVHIRLKRAAQILRDSKMNISEIAYSLGFSDHAHFTRHFRDAFGCPPREYRKRES